MQVADDITFNDLLRASGQGTPWSLEALDQQQEHVTATPALSSTTAAEQDIHSKVSQGWGCTQRKHNYTEERGCDTLLLPKLGSSEQKHMHKRHVVKKAE